MSILQYFAKKLVGSLPNPEGTLSNVTPAAIKSANSEVKKVMGQGHPSSRVSCKETRKGEKCMLNMLHIREILFGKCPTVSPEYFFTATAYRSTMLPISLSVLNSSPKTAVQISSYTW